MHTKSWALAAVLAFFATASAADAERPRIYFPRHVKRQFQNATITRAETFPSPEGAPFRNAGPATTKRRPGPDLADPGSPESPAADPPAPAASPESDPSVTTIYVETSTIIVTPTEFLTPAAVASTGGFPEVVVQPTASASEPAQEQTAEEPVPETPASSSGILLAPTGVVTPTASESPSASPTTESEEAPAAEPAKVTSSSIEEVAPVPETTTSSPLPETTTSSPPPETTTSSPLPEVTTSVAPAESVTAPAETTTSAPPEPTTEEQKPTNPLDPIVSIISSILPLPTPPVNTTDPAANITAEVPLPPPETTSSLPPDPTPDPTPVEPSPDTTTTTPPPETVTTPPVVVDPTVSVGPPPVNTTITEPPLSTPPVVDPPPVTDVPANTTVVSEPPAPTPPTTTSAYTISLNNTDVDATTAAPTDAGGDATTVFTSVPATATITNQESWLPTTIIVDEAPTPVQQPDALAPTVTAVLPSNLPKVISPNDPGTVAMPEDSVLLQIGFLCPLNYDFLSHRPQAVAQVFSLLPQALAYAVGIEVSSIIMKKLVPLDTTRTLGCWASVTQFYYPSSYVDRLRSDLMVPYSALYMNPSEIVYNLTQQINPAIDIIPRPEVADATGSGASSTSSASPGGDFLDKPPPAAPLTSQEMMNKAGIVVGSCTAVIAYGVVMFIVARRYKRKKQSHQRSSSITHGSGSRLGSGSSGMRYTGTGSPALMGGALMSREFSSYGGVAGGRDSHGSGRSGAGNSGRTAYISAPMAAENSLGWY